MSILMRKVVLSDLLAGDPKDLKDPKDTKSPKVDKYRKQVEYGAKKFIKP